MGIVIKPMESEEEICGKGYVHYQAWREAYEGLIDPGHLAAITPEQRIQRAHQHGDDTVLVAKDGERVVGFLICGAFRGEGLPGCGEIQALYILREYYGTGLGQQLMDAGLSHLSGYPRTALWVLQGNERAIRFYEKNGFTFDGAVHHDMLGTEVTELRMLRERC